MNEEVLICGAGPTGLVLACELVKRGISVYLIDKQSSPTIQSKALGIHARTLEVFDKMGLIQKFLDAGVVGTKMTFHIEEQKVEIPLEGIDSTYPFILILPQSETERILREHLDTKIHWSTEFLGIENDDCLLKTNDSIEKKKFSYIVGCDGAHSAVRHAAQIPFKGLKIKEEFFLADVLFDHSLHFQGPNGYFKEGFCLIVPFKEEKKYRLIFPDTHSENLEQLLDERGFQESVKITQIDWLSHFTIQRRIASHFQKDNIFLVGDAAHIHSPIGGQGMNMSVQDAENLAWKLALVLQKKAPPSLLSSYEKERKIIAKKILYGTTFATRFLLFIQRTKSLWLLKMILRILHNPHIRKRIGRKMSQTEIRYATPFIDRFSPGPQMGTRAPDVKMENGKRLYEYLRTPKFVLLAFKETAFSSPLIEHLHMNDHAVKERYNGSTFKFYLIRPDGYIAFRCRDEKEINNTKTKK